MYDNLRSNIRHAIRGLIRSPSFTLITLTTLTVAIGLNTALFSVVKQVLLDPLPFPNPEELVAVWQRDLTTGNPMRVTTGNFTDLAQIPGTFAAISAFSGVSTTITDRDEPISLTGSRVLSSYFDVLQTPPHLGRLFQEADDVLGGPALTILSYGVWVTHFGADSSVIGQVVSFDNTPFEIVGVMPPALYPTNATVSARMPFSTTGQDFWVPLRYSAGLWTNRRPHLLGVIGRLAPNTAVADAETAVHALGQRLALEDPLNRNEGMFVRPLLEEVVGDVKRGLVILSTAVVLVLLVAATNIAGLFLVRTESRRAEMTIRLALGAGRGRLIGQVVTETAVLSVIGGLAGVASAAGLLRVIKNLVPVQIPRLEQATIDLNVLTFTAVASLLTLALAGLVPAIFSTRDGLLSTMREQSGGNAGSQRRQRVQFTLVSIQTALAVVLAIGAGLLTRSFGELLRVDSGFVADGVMAVPLPGVDGGSLEGRAAVFQRLRQRALNVPRVTAAAVAMNHPLERTWGDGFIIDGLVVGDGTDGPSAALRPVGPGFFETARVRIAEGREFALTDGAGGPGVAIVNQALVQTYFGDERVIGRRITVPSLARIFGEGTLADFEIVGIAENVRFLGPASPAEPALYLPVDQFPSNGFKILIRTTGDPQLATADIRQVIREETARVTAPGAELLTDVLDGFHSRPRFNMFLLIAFAAISLALMSLGIYGLVSRTVALQRREIGIQMALGATKRRVLNNLLLQTGRSGIVGLVVGIIASLLLTRTATTMLFNVSATDPLTYVLTGTLLLAVMIAAAFVPGRRAATVNPSITLRNTE